MQGWPAGDGWSSFVLTLLLWETAGLQLTPTNCSIAHLRKQLCALKVCYKHNKKVSLHLPAFILISLPLHFGQDVIQGSYLRGDGVNLDPDSVRVHPGHPWAGQTLCSRAKLAVVVVGPDGAG